jgi:hypothetical protein
MAERGGYPQANEYINSNVNFLFREFTAENTGEIKKSVNSLDKIFTPFHKVIHKSSTICG